MSSDSNTQPDVTNPDIPWIRRWIWSIAALYVLAAVGLVHYTALLFLFPVSDTACGALPLRLGEGPYNSIDIGELRIYSNPSLTCIYNIPQEDRTITLSESLVDERNLVWMITGVVLIAAVSTATLILRRLSHHETPRQPG